MWQDEFSEQAKEFDIVFFISENRFPVVALVVDVINFFGYNIHSSKVKIPRRILKTLLPVSPRSAPKVRPAALVPVSLPIIFYHCFGWVTISYYFRTSMMTIKHTKTITKHSNAAEG
jgi:hypothetical protein